MTQIRRPLYRFSLALLILSGTGFLVAEPSETSETLTIATGVITDPLLMPFYPFPDAMLAEDVDRAMLGEDVTIVGKIAHFVPSSDARTPHRMILVERETDPLVVVYWPDISERVHGNIGMPQKHQMVSVQGMVSEYREQLQLRVTNPNKLRLQGVEPTDEPWAPPVRATSTNGYPTIHDVLQLGPSNEPKTIVAKTVSFREAWNERAPNILTVEDGADSLDVVFYPDAIAELPAAYREAGAELRITGTLSEYRGNMQFRLRGSKDLSLASDPDPGVLGAGAYDGNRPVPSVELDNRFDGKTVTVAGKVERLIPAGEALYVMLRDGDGVVTVLLEEAMKNGADARTLLTEGASVTLEGRAAFSPQRSAMVVHVEDGTKVAAK